MISIAIEGMDGVGKTTLAKFLTEVLDARYHKQPSKELGARIAAGEVPTAEMFVSDRLRVVRASLDSEALGFNTVMDRTALSTAIYNDPYGDVDRLGMHLSRAYSLVIVLAPPSKEKALEYVDAIPDKDELESNVELMSRVYDEYYTKEGILQRSGAANCVYVNTEGPYGKRSVKDLATQVLNIIWLSDIISEAKVEAALEKVSNAITG